MSGVYVGSREGFEAFVALSGSGRIHPVMTASLALTGARAYRYMESGQHFGKVVICT
jgi:NADPH:quinone reductase-like Zn-dependent oxidoreductase